MDILTNIRDPVSVKRDHVTRLQHVGVWCLLKWRAVFHSGSSTALKEQVLLIVMSIKSLKRNFCWWFLKHLNEKPFPSVQYSADISEQMRLRLTSALHTDSKVKPLPVVYILKCPRTTYWIPKLCMSVIGWICNVWSKLIGD